MNLEEQVLARIELGSGVARDALLVQHIRAESSAVYLTHRKEIKKVLRGLRQAKKIEMREGSYYYPTEISHE
jgi:hypothetical protein